MSDELEEEAPEERAPLPRWKKVLIAGAAAFLVIGFALRATGGGETPGSDVARGPESSAPQSDSFVPRTDGPTPDSERAEPAGTATAGGAAEWSPFFVKGGFSFFFGFCVGFALRAFFKISAIALGVIFLALLGLEHLGFVELHWEVISEAYDGLAARVAGELDGFRTFVTGSLPSAALGGVGLFAGFKGNR